MTVRKIKSIGDIPYPIDVGTDALSPLLTAGAALGITGNDAEESAWLTRTSEADGVASVRSIHGNTIVQDGALVPVQMEGIESTGFNQWDEQWEVGFIDGATGQPTSNEPTSIRSKNFCPCVPNTAYYAYCPSGVSLVYWYDSEYGFISRASDAGLVTSPSDAAYFKVALFRMGATYNHNICINLSDPTRNGTYEPYWQQQRSIPAGTLRGAGTAYDELTETERITRVGVVALSEISWTYDASNKRFSSPAISTIVQTIDTLHPLAQTARLDVLAAGGTVDAVDGFTVASNKIWLSVEASAPTLATSEALNAWLAANCPTMHVALATPTTTPYDPPLNMTYRTEQGGTERVMVPTGEQSAPPTIVTAQGYTAESLRDAALSAIAPVENGTASTNYAVGSYLVHGGQLCKVTTAIATGEAISIGTNVTATTVMAEVIALTQ